MFSKHVTSTLLFVASTIGTPAASSTGQLCSTVHLVHASGTFEEPGLGALGTPLSNALANAIPGATSYGVPYNTSAEYNKTLVEGAALTSQYLHVQAVRCPDQRFILSGLSKGAMVMHRTNLDGATRSKVLAVLVFGDPWRPNGEFNNSWPIDAPSVNLSPRNQTSSVENVLSFCNSGDSICETGRGDPNAIPPAHLTYPTDGSIGIAVNFVKAKVQ